VSSVACQNQAPPSSTASTPATATASSPPPPSAPAPPPPPPAPVPAELPAVIARVNSEDVKKADFERLLRNVEINNGPVPADRRDEILRRVLDDLVTYTVLKQEAKARNIAVSDSEVDAQMKSMREASKTEENFKKALAARKMSVEQLKADARVELAISKLMNEQLAGIQPVSDDEAKQYYEKNLDKFKRKAAEGKPAETVPFAEVSANLKRLMTEQKKEQQRQAFVTQLKQKSKIEVLI
jgi:hypothetical protein